MLGVGHLLDNSFTVADGARHDLDSLVAVTQTSTIQTLCNVCICKHFRRLYGSPKFFVFSHPTIKRRKTDTEVIGHFLVRSTKQTKSFSDGHIFGFVISRASTTLSERNGCS